MNNHPFHRFENDDLLAVTLANAIAENLQETIRQKGTASLIVSGGSTPLKLFYALSQINIGWENINIGLCDERWVAPNHPDSNEKLVRENLMLEYASKATLIGMFIEGKEPFEAQDTCTTKIKESLFPFDVVVLGMGDDAHTASLFPHNPRLKEAYESDALCIAIEPLTAPHIRMSLTRNAILSAHHIYLHFQGEKKGKLYNLALEGNDIFEMPIRSILHQPNISIEVYTA